ncbi:Cytoplasmic dynein 1 heavy chain 1 [Microtus ochrogaster]|uniref:Cytoplasmic dynein 1 heavy chain 1 n=1 Tax=Microtus ochrogaster TaxID=79684 RepID=A0A8J6KJM4_MICOH|nr:Cytoplasmic dynein 1 heavy chain 1 [Microtus ochrogaster]
MNLSTRLLFFQITGPAGTGKTESVKALGHQLGRFVLVFNCDETFDFQAMGRIFVGLCQVGAWGCFDEFNRLEERMLSAVSQQVQCIQEALREHSNPNYDKTSAPITCELLNKQVKVSPDMAIFITMNPGYAGRSNLPDNLKKLFRSLAMTKPDRQLIAQVMLYSQGFRTAEVLANKIVPFFKLCDEQLSSQSHYDFGLRALKSVLVSAGNVKRERIQKIKREKEERGEAVDEGEIAENLPEQEVEFPPDLCSRVTFVNFTVTRSSLQSQCLNEVLKAERPDVDEKRSDLLKLQGEFQLRLRQLEKSLLQALNEVKGRILDDDTIITTLENLKREAAEVTRKVEETDIVMQEVETVSQQYLPLSTACSSIYFTMESLKQVHFLYQYSLQFFLDIYHNVLYENPNLKGATDHTQRLSIITKDLFQVAFNRVARGMLHQDHITFAMLLARIKLKGTMGEPTYDAEFQHFLRGKEIVLSAGSTPKIQGLTVEQAEAVVRLSCLPAFKDLIAKVQADEQFGIWLDSSSPEQTVPYLWSEETPTSESDPGPCHSLSEP